MVTPTPQSWAPWRARGAKPDEALMALAASGIRANALPGPSTPRKRRRALCFVVLELGMPIVPADFAWSGARECDA
jgi:hypothetical protein